MGNAKRRASAKRKRQFLVNGSTIKHSKNSSATSTNASSSKIKIPAAFDEEIAEYQRKTLTGNRIIDMEVLLNLFLQLCCPRCFEKVSCFLRIPHMVCAQILLSGVNIVTFTQGFLVQRKLTTVLKEIQDLCMV
ncbi:hypothetical protein TNCV_3317661 [Trichonephila clavipes]|nr:hypothetical protein TNCV_3317661 [Trichonephila clavipes]